VHFLPDADPHALGHKSLAVSLSDLAAMGAEPAWLTLSLTLPQSEPRWLEGFSRGFAALANEFGAQLVGGDTTRGHRSVTVQALGFCEPGGALRRTGARPGDPVFVTGTLGDAGLALRATQGLPVTADWLAAVRERLDRPAPRVATGLALRGLARAAIDISDGLAADLGHILAASGVGARLELARLPLSDPVYRYVAETGDWGLPLSSGDDYELCFVLPAEARDQPGRVSAASGCRVSRIGWIEAEPGLRCQLPDGRRLTHVPRGFDHFAGPPE
jgi:thiamine-monophosphate kinase